MGIYSEGTLSDKFKRKCERASGKKFIDILHKGHWGNVAECAEKDGTVWIVDKKTGECSLDEGCRYENSNFRVYFQKPQEGK